MAIKHFIIESRTAKINRNRLIDAANEIARFNAYDGLLGFNANEYDSLCIDALPSLARLKFELANRIDVDVQAGQIAGHEDAIQIKVWFDSFYLAYNKITKIYTIWCDWDTARGLDVDEVFAKWYNSDESELADQVDWIEF